MEKKAKKQFGCGDKVSWVTKGHGVSVERTGTVHEVVAAGGLPSVEIGMKMGSVRAHESYVVFTTTATLRGQRGRDFNEKTDRLFWPRVGTLKLVRRAKKK